MKLLLYPHGGSGNHGCEAIVRSTVKIMQSELNLFSVNPEEDIKYGLDKICRVYPERQKISRLHFNYWKAFLKYHLGNKEAYDCLSFKPLFEKASSVDCVLSIGGDNYCYNTPTFILLINKQLRQKNIKTVLWGCSVEPTLIKDRILDDLKGYNHIFVRESLTYQAMLDKGIHQVTLMPDPAFTLDKVELPLPEGFIKGNTVGINISPMIIGYEKSQGRTLQNYINLIQFIIDNTDMQIALIPHVVWAHNDDRKPLRYLYDKFRNTRRIVLINDFPAQILKGFIARCRFVIAARTHASIAAYSEMIPTLVVGYSIKARGIATDIFGTEKQFVIPVQSLKTDYDLVKSFQWILSHEHEILEYYKKIMPAYKERVIKGKALLKEVLLKK